MSQQVLNALCFRIARARPDLIGQECIIRGARQGLWEPLGLVAVEGKVDKRGRKLTPARKVGGLLTCLEEKGQVIQEGDGERLTVKGWHAYSHWDGRAVTPLADVPSIHWDSLAPPPKSGHIPFAENVDMHVLFSPPPVAPVPSPVVVAHAPAPAIHAKANEEIEEDDQGEEEEEESALETLLALRRLDSFRRSGMISDVAYQSMVKDSINKAIALLRK